MASSREYREKRVVVWPVYLDEKASRGMGRKIPRSKAVVNPKIREIVEAARMLGLNPEVEEKAYPRAWWLYTSRVVVDKIGSKRRTLIAIAEKIKELRLKGGRAR
ncbi:signal recognition particle protein Srp19 [Stetteria hydrogenophila]